MTPSLSRLLERASFAAMLLAPAAAALQLLTTGVHLARIAPEAFVFGEHASR
jgi:hypothetical protein